MRPAVRALAAVAAVLPLLAALACGGRTDNIVDPFACPSPGYVVGGASCSASGATCPSTGTTCDGTPPTCLCENGVFNCGDEPVQCPNQCPASATPGSPCDPATQGGCSFPVTVSTCGGTYTTTCSCSPEGATGTGTWYCGAAPEPDCFDAQPPACPDPSTIQLGGMCTAGDFASCPSDIPIYGCNGEIDGYVSCFCDAGGWNCPEPGQPYCPDAPVDAPVDSPPDSPPPGCPDAKSVQQGAPCFTAGELCPGRPTDCGGQTLYDAFQCTDGAWDDVATTICEVDGSVTDAGIADAKGGG